MNIFDSLERSRTYLPTKNAILFSGAGITYQQLYERVCRLSFVLQTRCNTQLGDRVALLLPNIPEFVVSYYAVVRLGAIAVSLNVMFKHDELKFILNDSEAKLLITTSNSRASSRGKRSTFPENHSLCWRIGPRRSPRAGRLTIIDFSDRP